MSDLLELAERVETGNHPLDLAHKAGAALGMGYHTHATAIANLASALNGSLDAAKALHDAVLPGWEFRVENKYAEVSLASPPDYEYSIIETGNADNPAAAWVAAILRAKASMEET